ncbi:MAG: 50S ribosomal protein L11 methyltransferase [Prevotella sp.]
MDYYVTHFTIVVNNDLLQACRDLLADAVAEAGYESFADTEKGFDAYVQTQLYNPEMVSQIVADFPIVEAVISFTTEEVEPENWNAEFEKEVFEPIRVSDRCVIYDASSPDAVALMCQAPITIAIDQTMAFGNGAHETTKMIVTELLSHDLHGLRVLDCGCGTGILSLVAKRCGAAHVTAYDIDEWSVDNTRHNAELNGIELHDVLLGDVSVLSHVDGMFDVIVANINRNILYDDMPSILETLSPDGVLVLSGFYEDDAQMLVDRAEELGMKEVKRKVDNNWTMLCFKKAAAAVS